MTKAKILSWIKTDRQFAKELTQELQPFLHPQRGKMTRKDIQKEFGFGRSKFYELLKVKTDTRMIVVGYNGNSKLYSKTIVNRWINELRDKNKVR